MAFDEHRFINFYCCWGNEVINQSGLMGTAKVTVPRTCTPVFLIRRWHLLLSATYGAAASILSLRLPSCELDFLSQPGNQESSGLESASSLISLGVDGWWGVYSIVSPGHKFLTQNYCVPAGWVFNLGLRDPSRGSLQECSCEDVTVVCTNTLALLATSFPPS